MTNKVFLDTNVYRHCTGIGPMLGGYKAVVTEHTLAEIFAIPNEVERSRTAKAVLEALAGEHVLARWQQQVKNSAKRFLDGEKQWDWQKSERSDMLRGWLDKPHHSRGMQSFLRKGKTRWKEAHKDARTGQNGRLPVLDQLRQADGVIPPDIKSFVNDELPQFIRWALLPSVLKDFEREITPRINDFIQFCPFTRGWLTTQIYFMYRHGLQQVGVKHGKTIDSNDACHCAYIDTVQFFITNDSALREAIHHLHKNGLICSQAVTSDAFLNFKRSQT